MPGTFEIPLVAKKMAQNEKYDTVICLGSVIKGYDAAVTAIEMANLLKQF